MALEVTWACMLLGGLRTWFQHFTELGACAPHSSLETLDPGESTFPGCVVFCFSATSTWCYFQFSLEVQQGESIPFPKNFLQKLWDFILLRPFPASRNECFSQGLEEGLPYSSISWSLLVFLLLTCSFLVFLSSFTPPFWPFTEKPHTHTQPLTHACILTQMAGLIFFFFFLTHLCPPRAKVFGSKKQPPTSSNYGIIFMSFLIILHSKTLIIVFLMNVYYICAIDLNNTKIYTEKEDSHLKNVHCHFQR